MFLACAVPRIVALVARPDPPSTMYSALAVSIADDRRYALQGLPVTHIEPFYPAALAAGRLLIGSRPWSMLIVQVLAASIAGMALFAFTRQQLRSERAAWIATLLYACSPYLVRQSVSFMEVTIATSLLILAAWRMQSVRTSARAMAAGLLCGAIVLTRFSFLPIALTGIPLVWRREGAARAAIAAAVAAACIAPWMVHSRAAGGAALPPRIGENLFVSTSDWAETVVPRINVDVLVPATDELVRREMSDRGVTTYSIAQRDRFLLGRAGDYIRAHPVKAIGLKLRNLAYILQPRLLPFSERRGSAAVVNGRLEIPPQTPRPIGSEFIAGAFQALLLAGGAAGIWVRRRTLRDDEFLLVVLAGVAIVNVVFYPTSRLLAPMSFVLMYYTAAAVDRLRIL